MKISFVIFGCSFLLQMGLMYYYIGKLYPQQRAEGVYPLNVHGWVVYLNREQHGLLTILETMTGSAAAIAASIKILVLRSDSGSADEDNARGETGDE